MGKTIRLLIADDHTIVRSGLALLLAGEPGMSVVGEAEDGCEAVDLAITLKPDVVLMDIGMPCMSGLDAAREIRQRAPQTFVLFLTMHRSDEYFFQALDAGAAGYVLKGAEPSHLISAVRAAAKGEIFLSNSLMQRLVKRSLKGESGNSHETTPLTARELQVLIMIADGYTSHEIAENLVISPSTVASHRSNLMRKLQLASRHELVEYARANGYIRSA